MGVLITIEGVDGAGKTTQVERLSRHLESRGVPLVRVREPGGTGLGDQVREILVSHSKETIHPLAELLLFQASRVQLVESVIRPALSENKVVLCDRYADSTTAYQGYGRGMDLAFIERINESVVGIAVPDLTVVLDLDVDQSLLRALSRNQSQSQEVSRFEAEKIQFHQRVRQGFLEIARKNPGRVVVVDGSLPVEEVHQKIRRAVQPVLGRAFEGINV